MAAARGGDAAAFHAVVERYHTTVLALARAMTGDVTQSEEVAQETFVVAWTRLAFMRKPDRLRAWLCGIARFVGRRSCFQQQRQKPAGWLPPGSDGPSAELSPLDRMIKSEEERVVVTALGKIPEAYRAPLSLFYRERQSLKEIADALGISEKSTTMRLTRGRRMLRGNVVALLESGGARPRPSKKLLPGVVGAIAALGPAPRSPRADQARITMGAGARLPWLAAAGAVALSALIGVRSLPSATVVAAAAGAPAVASRSSPAVRLASLPGAPRPGVPRPPSADVPSPVISLDFEDGVQAPLYKAGHVQASSCPPRPGNTACLMGTVLAGNDYLVTGVVLSSTAGGILFSHAPGATLGFDYWSGAPTGRLRLQITDDHKNALYTLILDDAIRGGWAHAEVRFADFTVITDPAAPRMEEGDSLRDLLISAGDYESQFYVDNVKIARF